MTIVLVVIAAWLVVCGFAGLLMGLALCRVSAVADEWHARQLSPRRGGLSGGRST
jgi:hypothetical protein